MRLFIATDEFHSKELDKIKKEFDVDGVRCVGCFHLTFKFLGEIDEKLVENIKDRLKEVKFKKFKVKLSKIGVFPNEDYIRVVWVGLKGKEIDKLQKEIDEKLKDMFDKEDRFKAHITIGRVKFLEDKEKFKEKLRMEVKEEEFEIDKFILYGSELSKEGPKYVELGEFKAK